MTGTSARETSRPARRMNATSNRSSSSIAPPVLFRLPPISLPASSDSEQALMDVKTLRADVAVANSSRSAAQESQAAARAVQSTLSMQSLAGATPSAAQPVTAAKHSAEKTARQQLLNVLIVVLLLVALAIVSVLVFRNQTATPAVVNAPTASTRDPLASLAELKVPELITKAIDATATPNLSLSHEPSESLILGMDTGQLGKADDAATAQVQLGAPVPMPELSTSSLANTEPNSASGSAANPVDANNSRLPLTTPRYETVSSPSAANGSTESPRTSNSGDSPSLWDGAGKSTTPDRSGESGLVLTKPLGDDPTSVSVGNDRNANSSSAVDANRTPSNAQLQLLPQTSSADASESVNLGVTVGGGLLHPTNLGQNSIAPQSTATPDLDAATIGRKYVEFKEQKNAKLVSRGATTPLPNTQFGSTGGAPAATYGYINAGAMPSSAGATSGVPYGTTAGTLVTPYVRNAQGAQPSGLNPNANSALPPAGYSTNYPAANGGYAIPPRSTGYPVRSDTNSPAPASAASTQIPASPTYSSPTYSSPTYSSPSQASPTYSNPSAASSSGATPAAGYANAGVTPGNSVPANVGMAMPGGSQGLSRAPQLASPYPGGQAPSGMIGQSGYATAPSGDFVGGAPVSVNGTLGYATSTVGGMPTDARPTTSAAQGSTPYGAASTYGSAPQYR